MANGRGSPDQTRMVDKDEGKEGKQAAHQHHAEQWMRGSPLAPWMRHCIATRSIRGRLNSSAGTRSGTHRFFFSLSSSSPAAPAPPLFAAALPLFLLLLPSVLFLRIGGAANVVADIASLSAVGTGGPARFSLPLSYSSTIRRPCTVCTRMTLCILCGDASARFAVRSWCRQRCAFPGDQGKAMPGRPGQKAPHCNSNNVTHQLVNELYLHICGYRNSTLQIDCTNADYSNLSTQSP